MDKEKWTIEKDTLPWRRIFRKETSSLPKKVLHHHEITDQEREVLKDPIDECVEISFSDPRTTTEENLGY